MLRKLTQISILSLERNHHKCYVNVNVRIRNVSNLNQRSRTRTQFHTSVQRLSQKSPLNNGTSNHAQTHTDRISTLLRAPVTSLAAFGLAGVVLATIAGYYHLDRERKLETAMGKLVAGDSGGWSPNPEYFAKREFKKTKFGWFPVEDAFGGAGKPAIGGDWSLIDLNGNLVTNKSFEGKWTLLYFGFARCPDICPSEMHKVGKVLDSLSQNHPDLAANIKPIFVSIDPARDSLKALKAYAKDFHPDYVFLTGSPDQVKDMAKNYRVYVSKADETEDGDYLVDHSIVIYFHDDEGDLADCFTQSMRPKDVVEQIVERMTFVPTY
mmetsp:Transcript_26396/g.30675  ORF Transcript_26396/g.30675 Transcript_26396/m.30675 type:complete len:324 (+) Transcript_26396:102-1073(+)